MRLKSVPTSIRPLVAEWAVARLQCRLEDGTYFFRDYSVSMGEVPSGPPTWFELPGPRRGRLLEGVLEDLLQENVVTLDRDAIEEFNEYMSSRRRG